MVRRLTLLSLFLLLAACRFVPGEYSLSVAIPPLPAELSPWLEGGGWLTVTASGLPVERLRARAGESCRLELERSAVVSLCFCWDEGFPAAGGVLPYDAANDPRSGAVLDLTFEGGVAARLMGELAAAGLPLETINYPRLRRELEARSGGNPGLLDYDRLFRGLLSGAFTTRDIVLQGSYPLPPDSLEPGVWRLYDPLAPPLRSEVENRVYPGRHCCLREGEKAVLWIDEEGWRFYSPEGLFDRSGSWK